MKLSRPRCLSLRYSTKRHDMDRRVARPDPDDDLFDDEVERDLVGDTDFDDDGLVTYEEFRASVREHVELNSTNASLEFTSLFDHGKS